MHHQDLRSTTCSRRRKISATNGQGLVEYTMILALLAIVVILVLSLLGPAVGNVFSSVSSGLQSPGNRSVQQVNPVVTTAVVTTATTAAPVVTTKAPTTVATTATTVATTPTTAVTFFFNPVPTPTPEHGKGDGDGKGNGKGNNG